jgi:hypothetical protein
MTGEEKGPLSILIDSLSENVVNEMNYKINNHEVKMNDLITIFTLMLSAAVAMPQQEKK